MAIGDPPTSPDLTGSTTQAELAGSQFTALNMVVDATNRGFTTLSDKVKDAGTRFADLFTAVTNAQSGLQNIASITQQQANLFNVLGVAALGASKTFASMSWDTSGIQTFSDQIDGLITTVNNITSVTGLQDLAKKLNLGNIEMGPIEKMRGTIVGLAGELFKATDQTIHFQNGFLQMMGTTGQASTVIQRAGTDLSNLNNVLNDQQQMVIRAGEATNVAGPDVLKFYEALGQIPGALTDISVQETGVAGQTSNLQAVMELAHGTFRSVSDVIKDMTTAYSILGRNTEQQMEFTARISELSEQFGLRTQDTSGFLTNMANQFQFLGDNVDGTAEIFNQFFKGLKDGGLGVQPSIDLLEQLGGSIAKMSTAQRAFLSERTGGPGGLLGAVQIEQQLRSGDVMGVFNKMREALMQQFGGRIITQGQVTTQAEASQFERQRLLLQGGAFGGIARNEQDATRLLEVLAAPGQKSLTDIKSILGTDLERGKSAEQRSMTPLNQINANVEAIRQQGAIASTRLLQAATTPGPGGRGALGLNGTFAGVAEAGRQGAAAQGASGRNDLSLQYSREAFTGVGRGFSGLTELPNTVGKAVSDAFVSKDTSAEDQRQAQAQYAALQKQLQDERKQATSTKLTETQRQELMGRITADNARLAMQRALDTGQSVATAAQHQARTGATPTAPAARPKGPHPAPDALPTQKIVVDVRINGKHQSQQTVTLLGSHPATNPYYDDPGY